MSVSTYILPVMLVALIVVCVAKKVKVYDLFSARSKGRIESRRGYFSVRSDDFHLHRNVQGKRSCGHSFWLACKAVGVFGNPERSCPTHSARASVGQRNDCNFTRRHRKVRRGFVYSEMRLSHRRRKRNNILYFGGLPLCVQGKETSLRNPSVAFLHSARRVDCLRAVQIYVMKEPSLKANKAIQLANVRGRLCKSLLVSQDKKSDLCKRFIQKERRLFQSVFLL